jgi:membrane protein required for colicin V production
LHWLDILIIVVLALFLFSGIKRGFFWEIAGLAGIVVGVLLALHFSDDLTRLLQRSFDIPSSLLFAASLFLIFILSVIGFKLLAWGLTRMVKRTPLSAFNRLAGGVFSLLKGIILLSVVLLLVLLLEPFVDLNSVVQASSLGPRIRGVVPAVFAYTSVFHPETGDFFEEVKSAVEMGEVKESAEEVVDRVKDIETPKFPQDEELLERLKELFSRERDD